jgi:peptidoglycan pentaglycine glycine transferase (the first glycine)
MNFINNIDKDKYEYFVRNHKQKSHFLQSYNWGLFCSKKKGLIPHYVGLEKNGVLVATALLLQRKLPMGYSYFYSPRGYVLDYNNYDILTEFTNNIKKFVYNHKGIFIKIDPDIKLHNIDDLAKPINDNINNYDLVNFLKKNGYINRDNNRILKISQPKFTFRINIDNTLEEITKNISTSFMKNIKKSENYDVEVYEGTTDDIEIFYKLISATGDRNNFSPYNLNYYKDFFNIFEKDKLCKIFLGKIYPNKIILKNKLEIAQLNEILNKTINIEKKANIIKSIHRLETELLFFEQYKEKNNDGLIVSAHIVVQYGDKVWGLYAGSDSRFNDTFINNRVYFEKIKDANKNGYKIFDQFGTISNPADKTQLVGIHNFKKQFGGEYTEFIGEFDLVTNRFIYFIYNKWLKLNNMLKRHQ